ncbi:MAG: hypothetical protein ACYS22_16160, partial [Planctomycetota bacterium]
KRYLGDEKPVIEDDIQYGAAFMRDILEALDKADDKEAAARGLGVYDWKEAEQTHDENNLAIWEAVLDVVDVWAAAQEAEEPEAEPQPAVPGE